ncbi:hypothetical protein ACFQMA_23175 [Halosimplex aquaticum]|uniref:Uncharacterized protein n=1 Tax=Halosimplex aquaticum TaxID=3026162 RepID=A0ABD5Y5T7_9EURY|nr:hypothetical protein [Halosimplex aquaticum]
MASIFYEAQHGEVYQIDEVSQHLLVYVYLHGEAKLEDVVESIGAQNEHAVHSRIESQLGGSAAQLIDTERGMQQTFGERPDYIIHSSALTETGAKFVEKHRNELSMPVEIAELAKRVAALQIEDRLVDDLIDRIDTLEGRIEELE